MFRLFAVSATTPLTVLKSAVVTELPFALNVVDGPTETARRIVWPFELTTVLPAASCTAIVASVGPAADSGALKNVVAAGCVIQASFVAGPAFTIKALLVPVLTPLADALS